MSNSNPSINPADNDILLGTLNLALRKFLQNTNGMLPAKVIAVEIGPPKKVQVQPMIMTVGTDNAAVSKAQIASIPVLTLGGGGFVVNFPISPGDFGWILAADRDISLYLQNLDESRPNTLRMHSFSDSIFIPQKMGRWTLAPEDNENFVIQTLDGSVRVSLGTDTIKLTAPNIILDSNVAIIGSLDVQGGLSVEGGSGTYSATIDGSLRVNENITAGGTITPSVPP